MTNPVLGPLRPGKAIPCGNGDKDRQTDRAFLFPHGHYRSCVLQSQLIRRMSVEYVKMPDVLFTSQPIESMAITLAVIVN
jgi:hypothetical protein